MKNFELYEKSLLVVVNVVILYGKNRLYV